MKLLERITPVQIFLFICVVYLAGFFAHAALLHKTVYGDGIYYFSWVRSVIVDHDVNFTNEFEHLGGVQPTTALQVPGNKYTVGPGILWAPAYLMVYTTVRGDGYGLPYQIATGLVSVLSVLFAFLFLWRLLERYFGKLVSIMTIAAIAGATNVLFYGSLDVVNSHAFTFFAATVFLSLALSKTKHWFAIGVALGMMTLIRTQDILFGILLIPLCTGKNILRIAAGLILAVLPQLAAWQLVYGTFWISPYLSGAEGFHPLSPALFGVLFGLQNGLFLWTPITMIAFAGLFLDSVKKIPYRWYLIAITLGELYAVASWSTWWQGASYSGRMFVSILPIFAFGIASLFSWLRLLRWTQSLYLLTFIGSLTFINIMLIVSFLIKQ